MRVLWFLTPSFSYMNTEKEILNYYNCEEYLELHNYYNKTTIFNILGVERNENRHSAFLKWLFDNRSSHGFKDEPLKKLLRIYATKVINIDNELYCMLLSGRYNINLWEIATEKAFDKPEGGRIDIWSRMTLVGAVTKNVALIIENKIYSSLHNDQLVRYHKWWSNYSERKADEVPIEIYITPDDNSNSADVSPFVHITYPELLNNVLIPLTRLPIPQYTSEILSDYIRNLGKPALSDDGKGYSVLAVTKKEETLIGDLYEKYKMLFICAIIAYKQLLSKYKRTIKSYVSKHGFIDIYNPDVQERLTAFGQANELVLNSICSMYGDDMEEEVGIDIASYVIRNNNRDKSKYDVIVDGENIIKHSPKNRTALAIFREFVRQTDATLEDLRRAFPCNGIHYFYNKYYQHLFYDYYDEKEYKEHNRGMGLTFDAHHEGRDGLDRYGRRGGVDVWDFFTKQEDLLLLKDGMEVMVVKKWNKTCFDLLLERLDEINKSLPSKIEVFKVGIL